MLAIHYGLFQCVYTWLPSIFTFSWSHFGCWRVLIFLETRHWRWTKAKLKCWSKSVLCFSSPGKVKHPSVSLWTLTNLFPLFCLWKGRSPMSILRGLNLCMSHSELETVTTLNLAAVVLRTSIPLALLFHEVAWYIMSHLCIMFGSKFQCRNNEHRLVALDH